MFSMFRNREAEAVRCPLKGPFTFSYSKGGSGLNVCSYPASYLDSCSVRFLLVAFIIEI